MLREAAGGKSSRYVFSIFCARHNPATGEGVTIVKDSATVARRLCRCYVGQHPALAQLVERHPDLVKVAVVRVPHAGL